ncbi:hypothetical protein VM1G_11815 [Cytospora mali]|uniref:C2H2-type domain-containing protein n=1 Tax=Cytospora mali TaxID=578113 RepID=A0A194W6C1_CYTMA|nr:hypothetical protein VM1G_11815 [Valsa mali]
MADYNFSSNSQGGNDASNDVSNIGFAPFAPAFRCACGKGHTRLSTLDRHIKEVLKPRRYECPCCDYPSFIRLSHVGQHLRSVHQVSKKAAIEALLTPRQAVLGKGSRRRKAAGVVAAPAAPSSAARRCPSRGGWLGRLGSHLSCSSMLWLPSPLLQTMISERRVAGLAEDMVPLTCAQQRMLRFRSSFTRGDRISVAVNGPEYTK